MNTQQSTVTRFQKPEWADEATSQITDTEAVWSKTVHQTDHLKVEVAQLEDLEAIDAPVVRVSIAGNVLDMPSVDDRLFTPEFFAEIGVGLVVAAHKAQATLVAEAVTFERDEPARASDAQFESAFTTWHHCVTVEDGGAVQVTPARVESLSLDQARAYLIEIAHAIAVAEAAA